MRLNLAQALMCRSDLLLLDEPTNHLDLDAIVWLEDWLRRYAGTLMVVSHDRDFLDAVVAVVVHIDRRKLKRYSGNYSAFEEQRAQGLVLAQSQYEKQVREREHLQSFIDRFRAKATKARQAQSRMKMLERLQEVEPVRSRREWRFEFPVPARLPGPDQGSISPRSQPAKSFTIRGSRPRPIGYGSTTTMRWPLRWRRRESHKPGI